MARMRSLWGPLVSLSTALVIVAAALLILLTPLFTHAALDASGSAAILGLDRPAVHAISDATIFEMVAGPATFGVVEGCPDARSPNPGPLTCFYDPAEASHLRDARLVLWGFLGVAAVALLYLMAAARDRDERIHFWRAVSRGGKWLAIVLGAVGVFFLVAFDIAFEAFHRIFFPGGNWSFDPSTQRLVQLYPIPFWQITSAALGVLAVGAGLVIWLVGRSRVGRLSRWEQSRRAVAATSIRVGTSR
jgi:hypothetical protein